MRGAGHSRRDRYPSFRVTESRRELADSHLRDTRLKPLNRDRYGYMVQQTTAGGAMQKNTYSVITGTTAVLLGLGSLLVTPAAPAAGQVPDPKVCSAKANPPKDAVTQGGRMVLARNKVNCM